MVFENYSDFLLGRKFSNGLNVKISKNKLTFRDKYLSDLVKGKKVIHLGFLDHLPLLDKKIKENRWLHSKLIVAAEKCIGLDINKEGIEYLKNKYNIPNIYALDIINDEIPQEILKDKFDFLVIPDVLEHIGDPVSFLSKLKEKFTNVDKIIITVPNAFCFDNFKNSFKNLECINTDHRFWFTPYTITKIAIDSEFIPENILFVEHSSGLSKRTIIKNILILIFPMLRDTIILEARLK